MSAAGLVVSAGNVTADQRRAGVDFPRIERAKGVEPSSRAWEALKYLLWPFSPSFATIIYMIYIRSQAFVYKLSTVKKAPRAGPQHRMQVAAGVISRLL